jgi:hypothetical protein
MKRFSGRTASTPNHDTGLISTKVEPLLNNLHGDPRYAAFLKKIHLPTT